MYFKMITGISSVLILCSSALVAVADDAMPENALATVNGKPVVTFARDAVMSQLRNNGQQADEKQILDELINLELLAQTAEARGLHEKPEVAALARLQYIQTMAQALMGDFSKDIEITDEDLRAEYDKQTASMAIDEYRASHILLEDEANAKEVIDALAAGEDFAELAKSRSTGPTGPTGGDLGWFQLANMVPAFSNALESMKVGETSAAPVQSEFGWHVIQLVDKRGTNKPKYEDSVGELRNMIMRDRLTMMIDQLREDADIKLAE